MDFVYNVPTNLVFGRGKSKAVGESVARFGKRALIVTGKSTASTGLLESAKGQLEDAHVEFAVYDGVSRNPTTDVVMKGVEEAKYHGADCILALGGGSSIDAAKAIAAMVATGGNILDYMRGNPGGVDVKALPTVAVPTTCGTGSEVNGVSVLTDPATCDKIAMRYVSMVPKASIVAPELMETMPKEVLSAVTYDAMCHIVESYVHLKATPLSDALCEKALDCLSKNIVAVNDDIHDAEALDQVCFASTIAGLTIFSNGTISPHALEHPLSGMKNIVHGRGLAAVAPACFMKCARGSPFKFARVSHALGGKDEHDVDDMMRELAVNIGTFTTLSIEGFSESDIPELTANVMRTGGSKLTYNPVKLTERDITEIYEECM